MTKVEALKRLLCAIKNDGTTPDQIGGSTTVDVLQQFIVQYGGDIGELLPLTVTSVPSSTSGKTKVTVSGNGSGTLKYALGASAVIPAYHEDLTGWTTWNGTSDITADNGVKICVAEVDSSGLALKAGITTVHSNVS